MYLTLLSVYVHDDKLGRYITVKGINFTGLKTTKDEYRIE